jgi:hypothetical protein
MNERDPDHRVPDVEELFALSGGRVSRGLERMRLARDARLRSGRLAVLLALGTWLPLVVLAATEGVAWGRSVQVPLLKDFLPYGQLLIAIPVLVFGEFVVGRYLIRAVTELRTSNVLAAEDTPVLNRVLNSAIVRWRGRAADVVLLVLTCTATVVSLVEASDFLTGGWQVSGDRLTLAGYWYLLISMPVVRFLELRWVWRLALWTWVLWKVSRLEILPQPAHPDRAGGLAFLGATQGAFGTLVFAFGVQLSCLIADGIHFRGMDLMSFRGEMVAFVSIMVLVLLLPLLVFFPKLVRARDEHLLLLSSTAYRAANGLEREMAGEGAGELPAEAVSGLADFGALYENARLMRPLPLEMRHVVGLVLAAVAPFLPLVFLVMPAREVLETLTKLLI